MKMASSVGKIVLNMVFIDRSHLVSGMPRNRLPQTGEVGDGTETLAYSESMLVTIPGLQFGLRHRCLRDEEGNFDRAALSEEPH
jgi:hypothetical protein